jgi:ADP-ribosylglycohydrolase
MLGAIAGDCIGSIYEWDNIKTKDFPLFGESCHFTDDSILSVALADAILYERDYGEVMRHCFQP